LADSSDFWFWVLNLGAAVIGGAWFAFRWLHIARVIEDTPTSRVRSAAQGYVEIEGRSRPLPATSNLAPLTQRDCVWWRYRVQHRTESAGQGGRRERWRTLASGRSGQPFLLDDGTGECIVQPAGALVLAAESTTWYGATPWPTEIPGKTTIRAGERDYRYFEERIHVHEQVYALGQFRSVSGAAADDAEDATRALLAEWKQDQEALARRFDRDEDGSISLAEWEEARAEARRTVERQRAERPAIRALHVLGRPDGGRLYLLATFKAAAVAHRYRRRALLAFAGFAAAVYALGWLVQNVLSNA
jgi:E3 Ubiquitin ligase